MVHNLLFNTPLRRLIALYRTGGSSKGVVKTVTGAIVHVTDALRKNAKKVVCFINPVQTGSGVPSPENVRPITGWTGVNVTRSGKNLVEDTFIGYNLISNGTFEQASSYAMHIAAVKAGIQYTITTSDAYFVSGFFKDKPTLESVTYNNSRTVELASTFVAPIDGYVAFRSVATFSTAQLELGTSATSYEPYQGETYSITFPSEAGTVYGGTLDVTNGVLTVDRALINIDKFNWNDLSTPENHIFRARYVSVINTKVPTVTIPWDAVSDTFIVISWGNISASNDGTFAISPISVNRLSIIDHRFSTVADFVAANKNAAIVYPLVTPLTYQLAPTQIQMLLGENNLWHDGNGNLELKYLATA